MTALGFEVFGGFWRTGIAVISDTVAKMAKEVRAAIDWPLLLACMWREKHQFRVKSGDAVRAPKASVTTGKIKVHTAVAPDVTSQLATKIVGAFYTSPKRLDQ